MGPELPVYVQKLRGKINWSRNRPPEKPAVDGRFFVILTAMKTCPKCSQTLASHYFYKNKRTVDGLAGYCKKCMDEYNRKYKPRYISKSKEYYKNFRLKHRLEMNEDSRVKWRKDRIKCLKHYGGECDCCGENRYEFLSIDHINGGGNIHRKEIRGNMVRWLLKNGLPEGFRILCHNCNQAYGLYGKCPHKK